VNESRPQFTFHQRLALGLFVVIGLATFALGAMRLSNTIFEPLSRRGGTGEFKTAEQVERERNDALRLQDTDKDGLNDYDELYVFRTSPFLEDTDSDGDFDGKEVAAEADPNCPKGRTCRAARPVAANTDVSAVLPGTVAPGTSGSVAASGTAPQTANAEQIAQAIAETFGDPTTMTPEELASGIAALSSTELRAFLLKLGIPKEALDKTDDVTLRKLLGDSLQQMVQK